MNSLDELNSYNADQFEDWLRVRLIDRHGPDATLRRQAFDFRAFGIDRGESYLDDIVAVLRRLSVDAQRNFGVAVELLLQHALPGNFPAEGMADLIRIAGDAQAFNALARAGHIAGSSPWGEIKPSLSYDVLAVLMKFETAPEIYSSVKALATAQHFQDGFAIDAYQLLIRCRPENWLDDFTLLQGRINRYRQRIEASGNKKEIAKLDDKTLSMAVELSRVVPLSTLGLQLATIPLAKPPCAQLMRNLFGSAGPLILRDKLTSWVVEDRSNPMRYAPLECENSRLLSRFQSFCVNARLVAIPLDDEFAYDDPSGDSTIPSFLLSGPIADLIKDACQSHG